MSYGKPRSPLVVDSDLKFLDSLKADPKAAMMPPMFAMSGKEAQLALANLALPLSGVFISPTISNPGGLSVIRAAHLHRPATPIFIIYEGEPPFAEQELKRLSIQKLLPKPLSYSDLISCIAPAALIFDPAALIEHSKKNKDSLDAEMTAEDAAFLAIRAEDFLAGTKSFFDVYVRLGPGRYIKILQAGDAFTSDRVTSYLQKGVTHFYLRKEIQEQYLNYCDKLTTTLLKSTQISSEIKTAQTLNHGQETMSFLKNAGLSEATVQYAGNFVNNVNTLVRAINPGKNPLMKGFLADLAAYEHGVSTAMIAGLLAGPLGIESEKTVQLLGMASLMHDVGLYKMSPELLEEDESVMTEDQKTVFHTHPAVGAQILREIHGIDPAITQAVSQHHERRNKKGFPSRVGAGAVNRVAEIVGIADDFVHYISRAQKNPKINPLQEMELNSFDGFSHPVIDAFRLIFFEPQKSKKK